MVLSIIHPSWLLLYLKTEPRIFSSQHIKNICYMNTHRQSNPYVQLCVFLFQNTDNFISLR